jgi:DNA-binding response OmpR family regulator
MAKKILIVDDDEFLLGIYAKSFQNEEFEVLTAHDGQEAWDIMAAGNIPDVVFTGIIMPRMTGFELIGKMQSDPKLKQVVTVISSHRGRDEDKVLAKNMGVSDFIIQGATTPLEAIRRIKALLGVQGNFKITASADKSDSPALMNLLNREQGTNYLPSADRQIIFELERGEDGRFKIKLSE